MLRKGLAVAVILLFIGVAVAPSINAEYKEINDDITEPLDVGRFRVRGFGLFPRYSGDNVTFLAIRLYYSFFNGTDRGQGIYSFKRITLPINYIILVGRFNFVIYITGGGSDNPFEIQSINADVDKSELEIIEEEVTPTPIVLVLQLITKLRNHKDIENVETEDDVLQIIEGDEELNSIVEQLSGDDCGCEDDSSEFRWPFPVICWLLLPFFMFGLMQVMMTGDDTFITIIWFIGKPLNCFWTRQ